MSKAITIDKYGNKCEIDIELSPEAQKELDEIKAKVDAQIKPLYDSLGIDMVTEELYWSNGEVYAINKETKKRREIEGKTQHELNHMMVKDAVKFARENK